MDGYRTGTADKSITGGYLISRSLAAEMFSLKLNELPVKLEGTPYKALIEEIIYDYDKNNNVAVIDGVIGKNEFKLLKDILSASVMSPLDIVWYLTVKEAEMRNIRIICKAVFDKVSVDEVKDYMVTIS